MNWPGRPPELKPQKVRKRLRWEWCRLQNDFPDWPIWRVVSKRANAPLAQVIAFVLRLECLANRSTPRGSVADFSVDEFAASLQLRPNVVARIRAALEEPDISWIDQDFLAGFYERNPDHDDPTATERQRRRRAKLKAEREQRLEAFGTGPPGLSTVTVSRRDSVTVTTDQSRSYSGVGNSVDNAGDVTRGEADGNQGVETADAPDPQEAAQAWLMSTGKRMLIDYLQINPGLAETYLERWRRDLQDDEVLQQIMRGVDKRGHIGPRFHAMITDEVHRAVHTKNLGGQQALPLPPAPVSVKKGAA